MLDLTNTTPAGVDQQQSYGASRRTFALGGLAAAVAGLIVAPSIAPAAATDNAANVESIDLVLIELCGRIITDCKQQSDLQERMFDLLPDDDDYDMVSRRIQELDDEARQLARRVAKLPARTAEGVQARAAAIKAMLPVDYGIEDMLPITWHAGMLDALLRDLTGRA